MTAALETSAQMVQLVSRNNIATHVNACLGMLDSCVKLILMNVLQTLASTVSAEMGSTGTFVIAMLATRILTATSTLMIVTPGEFLSILICMSVLKVCFKRKTDSISTQSVCYLNVFLDYLDVLHYKYCTTSCFM